MRPGPREGGQYGGSVGYESVAGADTAIWCARSFFWVIAWTWLE